MNHNRRQFIGQCASMVKTSAVSAMIGRMPAATSPDQPLLNWAGNYQYGTQRLTSATSLAEVQEFVRKHDRLKVLGTRHCFNGIADSADNLLSLREMKQVVELDRAARRVTVESGMSYGQLCPFLDQQGFALHNLASLPHISIAGACATGTHGSGPKNGNLSTAVLALEIVTASGEILPITRNRDPGMFQAAVVNLGAIGVVTKVTLDLQPAFTMRQDVYLDLPMSQVREHFEDIISAGYSVSLFTDWQKGTINEVWVKRRVEKDATSAISNDFYGARPATANVHPIVELSAENCTEQMGVAGPWYERLPHFRMGFTPSSGKELQSEVLRAAEECRRGDRRRRASTRSRQPAPDDHGTPHHRGRRAMDEPVLQATQPRDSLHLEAGLAVSEERAADDRTGVGPIRREATLGQALHHSVSADPGTL